MVHQRRWRVLAWCVVMLLGLCQAWDTRHAMNADGVSYLDMADRYIEGDWRAALSTYWSPLYGLLIAFTLALLRPSPHTEFAAVHALNFVVFCAAFACFEYFARGLVAVNSPESTSQHERESFLLRLLIGYALFLWCALDVINIGLVTPDLLVAGFVFLLSGFLVRARRSSHRLAFYAGFGAVAGVGFLAKTVMLPIAVIFLGVMAILTKRVPRRLTLMLASVMSFLAVAAPLAMAFRYIRGYWTFGDSGRLAYAWLVSWRESAYIHWQGDEIGSGVALHPTRRILDVPPAFEFGTPIKATYAPWYDPAYWNQGLLPRFDFDGQLRVFKEVALAALSSLGNPIGIAIFLGIVILLVDAGRRNRGLSSLRGFASAHWHLLLPTAATLALYSFVHLELRYIGGFLAVALFAMFNALLTRSPSRSVASAVSSAIVVVACLSFASNLVRPLKSLARGMSVAADSPYISLAGQLRALGIEEGDRIAYVGDSFSASRWARVARVRIVAEITSGAVDAPRTDAELFWQTTADVHARAIAALRSTGAKAIVARVSSSHVLDPAWTRIGNEAVYILRP